MASILETSLGVRGAENLTTSNVKSKGRAGARAVLCDSETQNSWWCGDAYLPDMGRPICGRARMMYAGQPHETEELCLGPEIKSHVGLGRTL